MIVGICTHLGCSPTFRPEVAPPTSARTGRAATSALPRSHYDLAGRVYKGQPAPLNLPIPPYTFDADDVITIGVDQEKA